MAAVYDGVGRRVDDPLDLGDPLDANEARDDDEDSFFYVQVVPLLGLLHQGGRRPSMMRSSTRGRSLIWRAPSYKVPGFT